MPLPLPCRWDGDGFVPLQRFAKEADRAYVVGEVYRMAPVEDRSGKSHGHYFAALSDAWANLPEGQAERFPSAEHLRKWALIKAGWRDERSIVAASKAEAQRLAAFVRPMDEFAVVLVSGPVVTVYTAQSQSMRAMGKQAFEASKQAVLDIVAGMIGVTADALYKQAGQAA